MSLSALDVGGLGGLVSVRLAVFGGLARPLGRHAARDGPLAAKPGNGGLRERRVGRPKPPVEGEG
jgi:hypothetical protein